MATPQSQLGAGQQAPQLLPFRGRARKRRKRVGAITFATNQPGTPLQLDTTGYLINVILQLRVTMTLSSGGALADRGPWNLLNRLRIQLNGGKVTLWDMDGYNTYLFNAIQERCFAPDKAGIGGTTPDADMYAAPVASGANTWVLTYVIPVAANPYANSQIGLINLQSQQVRVTVEPVFGPLSDACTNATACTGTLEVAYEYFEVPDPSIVQPPPLIVVRGLQETIPVNAVGDVIYTMPHGGSLLQMITTLRLNNARSNSYDSWTLRFNNSDYVEVVQRQLLRTQNRREYGYDMPTGVFVRDFWHENGDPSMGDTSQAIDTENINTIHSITTVSASASLGAAGTNNLDISRRVWQYLQR